MALIVVILSDLSGFCISLPEMNLNIMFRLRMRVSYTSPLLICGLMSYSLVAVAVY